MDDYRKKAEECLRAAEKMRNPAERIEMLSVARAYTSLADYASHTHRADESQGATDRAAGRQGRRGVDHIGVPL
jgi:hypothetical protein